LASKPNGGRAVARLTHNLNLPVVFEESAEPSEHQSVVIDQEYGYFVCH
jgi:hypothetical protein